MVSTLPLRGSRLASVLALSVSLAMGVAFPAAAQLEDIVDERDSDNNHCVSSKVRLVAFRSEEHNHASCDRCVGTKSICSYVDVYE